MNEIFESSLNFAKGLEMKYRKKRIRIVDPNVFILLLIEIE
jgi:hypothetical protein